MGASAFLHLHQPEKAMPYEKRTYDFQIRASADNPNVLTGYASVFDEETELRDGLFEIVRKGAFKKTLREGDIRALWNHDDSRPPLGRTRAGTLKLEEDDHGLRVEIIPPESAADVVEAVRRGDVSEMSFGFVAIRDAVTQRGDKEVLRELLEVRLFEVSPVVWAAYPTTEISARKSLISDEHAAELRKRAMPQEEEEAVPPPAGHPVAPLRRRLQLLQLSL